MVYFWKVNKPLMRSRVITSIIAIAIVLLFIFLGKEYFGSLVFAVICILSYEYFKLARVHGYSPFTVLGIILNAIIVIGLYFFDVNSIMYSLFSSFIIIFLISMFSRRIEHSLVDLSITAMSIAYFPLLAFLIPMYAMQGGKMLVLFSLILIWCNDTFSFFGGMLFGRHKLARSISPNKTVEGAAVGLVVAVVIATFIGQFFGISDIWVRLSSGIIVGCFAQIGDLFESYIKRRFNTKDSGNILPGHGGLMDRTDSIILTAFVMFWFFKLLLKG